MGQFKCPHTWPEWRAGSPWFDFCFLVRGGQAWGYTDPDSKVHGANMGPIWGRQHPGIPHIGPMKFAIWVMLSVTYKYTIIYELIGVPIDKSELPISKYV